MDLPKLRDDECFTHDLLTQEGEVVGVIMVFTKRNVEITRVALVDLVYAARCDVLRPMIEDMIVQVRAAVEDDS